MELFILLVIIVTPIACGLYFYNKKVEKHEALLKEVPIFWTENLGRGFIVIGSVSFSDSDKISAEIKIIEQAKKLGADAIICSPLGATTSVYSRKDNSVGSSNTFHYNGSAIKFKEDL